MNNQTQFNFDKPYPDSPGYRNTDTSRQAAQDVKPRAKAIREMVLAAIRGRGPYGATPPELEAELGIPVLTVQPRFSELKAKGRIVDSGRRRLSAFGKKQIVWVCPEYKK